MEQNHFLRHFPLRTAHGIPDSEKSAPCCTMSVIPSSACYETGGHVRALHFVLSSTSWSVVMLAPGNSKNPTGVKHFLLSSPRASTHMVSYRIANASGSLLCLL
jgi:hypothetical protein